MKVELDIDDAELKKVIETCVKDYVFDSRMISNLCRNAIYQMTAEAAQKVLLNAPETMRELVELELKAVVAEAKERRDY